MIGIFDSGIGGLTVAKAIMAQLPQYQLLYLGDTARTPYGNRSPDLIYQFTAQAVAYLFSQGCPLVILACNTASAEALRKIQQEWLPQHYSPSAVMPSLPVGPLRRSDSEASRHGMTKHARVREMERNNRPAMVRVPHHDRGSEGGTNLPTRRVLGVIRPVAEAAAAASRFGRIGVVGTRGTVGSGAFVRELQAVNPQAQIFQQACPLLVPLVEEGWIGKPVTTKIIREYLRPLKLKQIDTLVLGCTHYPMLLKQFRQVAGKRVSVPDPAAIVAAKLADYLTRHPEIERQIAQGKEHRFLATDLTDLVQANAQRWLGRAVEFGILKLP